MLLMIVCFAFGDILGTLSPSATLYSGLIEKWARRRNVDRLLVASIIHNETGGTWNPRLKSRTNDYGLMQLHVSRTTHSKYIRRERLLFNPNRNIRLGTRAMKFWKWYHRNRCKGKHHWLLHYNQGRRVSTRGWRGGYARRVLVIYFKLKAIQDRVVAMR